LRWIIPFFRNCITVRLDCNGFIIVEVHRWPFTTENEGLYCILLYNILEELKMMKIDAKCDEIRWQVLKAMLDEFPCLKEKAQRYLMVRDRKRE